MADGGVTITIGPDASPELVERLRAAFPDAAVEAALQAEAPPVETQIAAAAEEAVASAVASAGAFPELLATWWAGLDGGGPTTLATMAAALAAAYAAERGLRLAVGSRAPAPETTGFTARFRRAMPWLAGRLAGIALFAVLATAIFRMFGPWEQATAAFARSVLQAAITMRLTIALVDLLAAPADPARRLMGFDDADAARAALAGRLVALSAGALAALQAAVVAAAGGLPASVAPLALLAVVRAAVTAGLFLAVERPVRTLLVRQLGEKPAGWRRFLAARWAVVYFILIGLDFVLRVTGLLGLLGGEGRLGTGPSMLVLIVAPLAVAGLRLWRAELGVADPLRAGLFSLSEGLIALATGALLTRAWGIDPFEENATGLARLLPGLVQASVVAVAGFAVWRAAATVLAAPPRRDGEAAEEGEEGGGVGGTRFETALPILRGFVLAVIGVTTVMTALSALGMNIAPLLASAGVLGLAIGFGAQRLVADVISGLFYLYEDAFRVGEYIETGSGKGAVERISIRSVRLRHPRGPVYTIPFSAMGTVQNHSRDYATMKFTFSVPSSVDLEMIRKLVKKTGEEMMSDPDLQGKILAPLKSQGALRIVGRSYEIGCKFTAKPGQQFAIRRKAYAALQKALSARGIEFFAPQLTVAADNPMQPVAVAGAPT
jgi:small-conductance mechanosensitive channel